MKGILFKEPLFHKVVAGTKTQTRRIINLGLWDPNDLSKGDIHLTMRPRYRPGEIVYLKEPYLLIGDDRMMYKYENPKFVTKLWKNKLFMPEKYARYFIQITDVIAERANAITEEDARAEGCKNKAEFEGLWMQINGISSWKDNPWVWKYTFKNIYEL